MHKETNRMTLNSDLKETDKRVQGKGGGRRRERVERKEAGENGGVGKEKSENRLGGY